MKAQLLQQRVSSDRQQHAERVRSEVRTTGAVGLQRVQFLNSVIDFAALALKLIRIMTILKKTTGEEGRVHVRRILRWHSPPDHLQDGCKCNSAR